MSNEIRSYLPSLVRCDTCGTSGKEKLKRCGGCGISRYCSKECQRAAWPEHQMVCKSDAKLGHLGLCECHKEMGYPSSLALATAMRRWTDAHVWTLTTLANAVAYPEGAEHLLNDTSKAVVFYLIPPDAPPADGNPSRTFKLGNARIEDPTTHAHLSPVWADLKRYCVVQSLRTRTTPGVDPNFLGFLPAIIVTTGAAIITHQKYPIFRLGVRHVPDDPTNERTRQAFDEYVDMLLAAASAGHLFRNPTDPAQLEPDVGIYVRNRKTWEWAQIVWDWASFSDDMEAKVGPLASGLSLREHLALFRTVLYDD